MTTALLKKTPLHDWHAEHQGRMVDFAGWSMPVQYASIVEEHVATRTAAGLFDISHMGRLRFDGPDAARFLDYLVTRRVDDMTAGKIRYALVTNRAGGVLDDVLVYSLTDANGPFHMMVVNASNCDKICDWIEQHVGGFDVRWQNQTMETSMIAVQGPRALEIARPLLEPDPASLRYFCGTVTNVAGQSSVVSRTGYTGEDGLELIVPNEIAVEVWSKLMASGSNHGLAAAGLGARDTLRLESGMPLYGHELTEQINPLEADLGFAVSLQDRDFIGRAALAAIKQTGTARTRVGLKLDGKRAPREHYAVLSDGEAVGEVTSGTFSPTLQYPVGMAYVKRALAEAGNRLEVDIRGKSFPATVVPLPFYKRP